MHRSYSNEKPLTKNLHEKANAFLMPFKFYTIYEKHLKLNYQYKDKLRIDLEQLVDMYKYKVEE